jgi:DNA polymerase III subunit delta'
MLFKEIIGQEAIKQRLIKMAVEDRISHALLFLGQTGSGTLPLAVAFAQYINCHYRKEMDSCGECFSCKTYQKLVHPDLHFALPVASNEDVKKPTTDDFINQWRKAFIDNPYLDINDWYKAIDIEKKQGIIGTDESTAVVRKLFLKSFEGKYKILIMWHSDKMNNTAANKLLKIIEEPPENTLFMLVTEQYESMLPTIISRTQLVKVPLIETQLLVQYVKENYSLEINKAKNLVHLAANSYTAIQELVQQEQLSGELEQAFIDWMRLCWNVGKDYKKLYSWVEDVAKQTRDAQKNFLHFALDTARECLITNMAGAHHSRFDESNYAGFERFSKMISEKNIEAFTKEVNEACFHIERNANAKILFLDLSFKIQRILKMQ